MENKIVTAIFKDSTHTKVSDVWQYDYGQILRIQGLDLPTAVEVDFAVAGASESIARIGTTKDGVTDVVIPDSLIETGNNLVAYIYLRDSASGNTEYQIDILVTKRAKPEAYDRPEDKELFGQAIEAVNTAADRAEKAGQAATEAAGQAAEDAQQTAEDRKEVAKMVETVSGISEQVKKVEELSQKAQEAATKAGKSEQAADGFKTQAESAKKGAEAAAVKTAEDKTAVDNAKTEVLEAKTEVNADRTVVEQVKNEVEQLGGSIAGAVQSGVQEITQAGTAQKTAVEAAGTQAVESVENVKASATEAVETVKTEAIQAVQEEGTTQTGNVTTEGTKQVKAVQAAAQEIAADREQIKTNKADITDLRQTKAGAIINSAKGERIAVGDSAGAFFEGLKLYGKTEQVQTKGYQLFDASKIATKSAGGATVTNNGDGSFTISGSGNLTGNFVNSHVLSNEEAKKLFKAGRVTLKGDKTYPFVYMQIKNTAGLIKELKTLDVDSERYLDLTSEHINSEGFHVSFGICGSSGGAIIPGTVKPMVYQDGDGTWEPFTGGKPSPSMEYKQDPESSGDGGELEVKVKNSNLLGGEELAKKIVESGGTRSGNLVSFMCEKSQKSILFSDFEDDAEYTLILYGMCKNIQYSATNLSVTYNDSLSGGSVGQFTKKGEFSYCVHKIRSGAKRLLIVWDSTGTDIDITKSGLFKGQVDLSDFIESNTQTFSLQTPNGLPGLPIDSGGNYTDSNGQQWICDEMDFKRGKYVQRVRQFPINICNPHYHASYSSDSYYCFDLINPNNNDAKNIYKRAVLCNAFVAKNGSNMQHINDIEGISTNPETRYSEYIYIRVKASRLPGGKDAAQFRKWLIDNNVQIIEQITPIETDIPEETMTAYRKLYTNYPSTVIQNDSGAGMEVEYVADTKSYIDNKLKELVQAAYGSMANMLSLMPMETQAAMIENDTNNILENAEEMKHE